MMRMKRKKLHRLTVLLTSVLLVCSSLFAQNMGSIIDNVGERLKEKKILRINGNASGRIGYNFFDNSDGQINRRVAPFLWSASAGLGLDFLGIKAPFSMAISSRNTLYNLPSYSFYGISPTYKWATLHAGDRSMSFSPYSLSGINFRGAGMELRPGKFYAGAMWGQLRRARQEDVGSIQTGIELPVRRLGMGVKLGYQGDGNNELSLSLFSSRDELEEQLADTLANVLRPERNMVLALSAKQQISKLLSFEGEWAHSVLTRDDRSPLLNRASSRQSLLGLYQAKVSTIGAYAYNFSVAFAPKFGTLNFKYERIGPEYNTHGSLFFQNDVENTTLGLRMPLLKNKLNLSSNVGLQRNDLDGKQAANLKRLIGALNFSYQLSDATSVQAGFSNFTTTNRYKTLVIGSLPVDSLVLAQTNLSVQGGLSTSLGNENSKTLSLSASYQHAYLLRENEADTTQESRMAMLMLSYNYQPTETGWGYTLAALGNRNLAAQSEIITIGPSATLSKQLWEEKLALNVNISYMFNAVKLPAAGQTAPGSVISNVLQTNVGGSFKLAEKQALQLTLSILNAAGNSSNSGYNDGLFSCSYSYQF